jgi:hypothetical protein
MAKYLVLIYEREESWANAGQEGYDLAMKEHTEFGERNGEVLRGGEALQPTTTATSIRSDGDRPRDMQVDHTMWCHTGCLASRLHPSVKMYAVDVLRMRVQEMESS